MACICPSFKIDSRKLKAGEKGYFLFRKYRKEFVNFVVMIHRYSKPHLEAYNNKGLKKNNEKTKYFSSNNIQSGL